MATSGWRTTQSAAQSDGTVSRGEPALGAAELGSRRRRVDRQCVLVPELLARGYRVRVLDRLYFGEDPMAAFRDRLELMVADVRDVPAGAFDGVDGVINLAGLSNDPTAEYNPRANWEMNAIATETLAQACLAHDIERYVFASSCSLYDGLPPGMHAEDAAIGRRENLRSKRYPDGTRD